MCSVAGTRKAELDCSVLEEDWQRGQSYMAHWHSLTLVPDHHHRLSVMEAERSVKHWEARRLLQRFLSGAISKNHPHPETFSARRPHQPVADPSATEPEVRGDPVRTQKSVALERSERKSLVKTTKLSRFLG